MVANKTVKSETPSTKTSKKVVAKDTKTKTVKVPKVTKSKKPVEETDDDETDDVDDKVVNDGVRHFKCISLTADGTAFCAGRYEGKKPMQAASKACTQTMKKIFGNKRKVANADGSFSFINDPTKPVLDENTDAFVLFAIHECTRRKNANGKSNKKKYFYVGSRIKLAHPNVVVTNIVNDDETITPTRISYEYKNKMFKADMTMNNTLLDALKNYDSKNEDKNLDKELLKLKRKEISTKPLFYTVDHSTMPIKSESLEKLAVEKSRVNDPNFKKLTVKKTESTSDKVVPEKDVKVLNVEKKTAKKVEKKVTDKVVEQDEPDVTEHEPEVVTKASKSKKKSVVA